MKKILFVAIFLLSFSAFANGEKESKEIQEEDLARLHLDKDWRVKKELSFETDKPTKLC